MSLRQEQIMFLGQETIIDRIEDSLVRWRQVHNKHEEAVTGRFGIGGFHGILPPPEVLEAQAKELYVPSVYPPAAGWPYLREAIAQAHFTESNGRVKLNPGSETSATMGARHALMCSVESIVRHCRERTRKRPKVILLEPGYGGTYYAVLRAGGDPVLVPCGLGYDLRSGVLEAIEEIKKKRSVLAATIFEGIHNPSGTLQSAADSLAIGNATHEAQGVFISDEVYNRIVRNGDRCPSALELFDHREVPTIVIRSGSKELANSRDRVGHMAGTSGVIERTIETAQRIPNYGVPSICQRGYAVGLTECAYFVERMRQLVVKRGDMMFEGFAKAGWPLGKKPPHGMFVLAPAHPLRPNGEECCLDLAFKKGVRIWTAAQFCRPGSRMANLACGMVRLPLVEDDEHMQATFQAIAEFSAAA